MRKCPVFICYRQVDGTKIARWLFETLHGQRLPDMGDAATEQEIAALDVYFDQTAPAVGDWKAIHQPRLRTSQAMIVVCTPGAAQRLDEKNDWVHLEIDWWLKNRNVAPILIDATGEGERWVPKVIKDRWPDAQRIAVVQDDLLRLQGQELRQFEEQVRSRILNGIVLSKHRVVFEDLERQKKMSKRLITALVVAGIALVSTLVAAVLAIRAWDSAKENERIAGENARTATVNARLALARQLAAQSELTRNQQPNLLERSVLLAVESMRRFPSLEADLALRRGLDLLPRTIALMSHPGGVTALAFSPDGRFLVTSGGTHIEPDLQTIQDNTARVWDVNGGAEVYRVEHDTTIGATAFSPDGKYLATASHSFFAQDKDYSARLWDATSGNAVWVLKHDDQVQDLAFSPDSQYLATLCRGRLRLWSTITGEKTKTIVHRASAVTFSPDSRYLASAGYDNSARIWMVETGKQVRVIRHDQWVSDVAFSPDGDYLATASRDESARLWELADGREVYRMNHNGSVSAVAFSPDGQLMATASEDQSARLWDLRARKELLHLVHNHVVSAVKFSPDGKYLLTASTDGTARLWNVTSGGELARIRHQDMVTDVGFSPDGKYTASASLDQTAKLSTLADGAQISAIRYSDELDTTAFSPDGKYVASASSAQTAKLSTTLRVWEVASSRKVMDVDAVGRIRAVALSLDGRYLATLGWDDIARVWQVETGREIGQTAPETKRIESFSSDALALSSDGKYLAKARKESVLVWEISEGEALSRSPDYDIKMEFWNRVDAAALSPDGTYVAVAGAADFTVQVWQVTDGEQIAVMAGDGEFEQTHADRIQKITFSSDGKHLATASWDNTASVWEATTGRSVTTVHHEDEVWDVAFSPDGRYLATSSSDVRVWEIAPKREMARITGRGNVAFTEGGRYLVTSGADQLATVWVLWPEDLIDKACPLLTRNLTFEEWQSYLPDEPYRKTCPNLPIHPSFIEAGRDLASAGDVDGAVTIFRRALELEPDSDLDPEAEARRLAPPSDR